MKLPEAARIEFQTPEGVALRFDVATIARRLFAFAVDSIIIGTLLTITLGLMLIVVPESAWAWSMAAYLVFSFLVRNFYFVIAEMHGRGQTPGKRLASIRVADVHGRPLSGNAIFLRNITRDLETFLPIIAIFAPQAVVTGAPWWAGILALSWLVVIGLLPVLTPRRTRVGDLVAGTIVVTQPSADLLHDIGEARSDSDWLFNDAQLDMYGVYELQVLEKVMREDPPNETLLRIAEKIATKIGETETRWRKEPRPFLSAFYTQMRRRHEHRILLGDRQETKLDGVISDDDR